MAFEFELPDLGEGVAEAEVVEWHVAPGDRVAADDVIADVETDKAVVDVPSPVAGTVRELHVDPGEVVPVGTVLVTIDTDQGGPDAAAGGDTDEGDAVGDAPGEGGAAGGDETVGERAGEYGGRVFAPPSVRRLARDLGVNLATIDGSGPGGRITERDVRGAAGREAVTAADAGSDGDQGDDGPTAVVSRVGGDGDERDGDERGGDERDGDERGGDEGDGDERGGDEGDGDERGGDEGDGDEGDGDEAAVKGAVRRVSDEGTERRDRTLATPATRKLARELGVDIDAVPTDQARDGEPYVDEATVRRYAEARRDAREGATDDAEVTAAAGDTAAAASDAAAKAGERAVADERERREPYRGIRRSIGERMARSRSEVPHATHYDVAEVSGLVAARQRLGPLAEERGVQLTYLPFVLKSVATALAEHPILNAELDEDTEEIVYKDYYHLGVATATDRGLLVPVVRDVDEKGLLELAGEVNRLVERARAGDLEREEMQGGTFTVTNVGAIGGEYADPIVNVPQVAILAVGALRERPVVEDGAVVAAPTLPLSLAIDHRVVDGADAARFTNTLKEYLADPTRLLLE